MVFALTDEITFPDPHYGDPDGLLAVGGDLSTDRLILAYSNGIFPWYTFQEGMIQWWCPLERFVIFPDEIHISHSMRTLINKGKYDVTINQAFDEVIRKCGELRMDMEGAWLGPEMIEAYTLLHEQGFAASVEIWEGEQAEQVRQMVRRCPKNCWMVGTASPVMHKYIKYPLKWALKNKLRSLQGKTACLDKCWYNVGQDPSQGDLREVF